MNDNIFSDIIELRKSKIGRNKVILTKRRARLVGPNGVTLKAIELLTKCYILVHGYTVSIIGDYKGIKRVRQIVMDCMRNIHPIYQLKKLMTVNELSKNDNLKNENWNRLLPTFKKIKKDKSINNNNLTTKLNNKLTLNKINKVKQKRKNKKKYTPWPNDPIPSKIDIALETGQYWDVNWRKNNLKRYSDEQKMLKMEQQKKDLLTQKIKKSKFQKKVNKIKRLNNIFKPNDGFEKNVNKLNKYRLNNKNNNGNRVNVGKMKSQIKMNKNGNKSNNDITNWFLHR